MPTNPFRRTPARPWLALIALAMAAVWLQPAQAIDGRCVAFCDDGGSTSSGGGSSSGHSYPDPDPSQHDLNRMRAVAVNSQGLAARDRGDHAESVRFFRGALKLSPGDAAFRRNLAYALNDLGVEAFTRGDFAAAVRYCREAVDNAPGSDVLRKNLEEAEWKVEWQRRQAEYDRGMAAAKEDIGGMLAGLGDDLDKGGSGAPGMALMEFDTPPSTGGKRGGGLKESKTPIGLRLMEVEEQVTSGAPGGSAWDGGRGGTLDRPQASAVTEAVAAHRQERTATRPVATIGQVPSRTETRGLTINPVPSPKEYKSAGERQAMAQALSDDGLDNAINRTEALLKRMQMDFGSDTKALEAALADAQKAEEDALIASLDLVVGVGLEKFPVKGTSKNAFARSRWHCCCTPAS